MNNLYLIDAGMHDVFQEMIEAAGFLCRRTERQRLFDFVAAPTRGTARAHFVHAYSPQGIEWTTPVKIRKLGTCALATGIIDDLDHIPDALLDRGWQEFDRIVWQSQALNSPDLPACEGGSSVKGAALCYGHGATLGGRPT